MWSGVRFSSYKGGDEGGGGEHGGFADEAATPDEARREALLSGVEVVAPGAVSAEHADSARNLLRSFYIDQFRPSRDPEIPNFMFMSKDARYTMGVGGVIRLRGWFDWNHIMHGHANRITAFFQLQF